MKSLLFEQKVIIIGSGPAGLTAALYTARANLEPLVITGNEIGGQISLTNEVANYPGFPEGVTGPELAQRFQKQTERFGARLVMDEVVEVRFKEGEPLLVKTHREEHQAQAVIVATGAHPRWLGVPGELEFTGRGVSYCATCDGFFYTGRDVVVVGGGDSALEEGIFLTRFASQVRIVHRRAQLRAGPLLQERARANEKIGFIWNSVVEEILGGQKVEAVRLRSVHTDERSTLATDGVFVCIGHVPNTDLFRGQLEMDDHGYVITDKLMRTNVPGVFAAGEVQDPIYRQVATSVGQGCAAAMQVEKYIAELEGRAYPG